jgi:hypothetical protein
MVQRILRKFNLKFLLHIFFTFLIKGKTKAGMLKICGEILYKMLVFPVADEIILK